MNLDTLLKLVEQSPTVALVLLVWWELRGQSAELRAQSRALAVLVDRTGRRPAEDKGTRLELVEANP